MGILETQSLQNLCPGREGSEVPEHNIDSAVPVRQLESQVLSEHPAQAHEVVRGTLQLLLRLLAANPKWGILDMPNADVIENTSVVHELALLHPPVPWTCWISLRFNSALSFLYLVSGYAMCALVAVFAAAGLVKLYRWRRDRLVQEQQETFELVEQALTVLISQYQMMLREGRGAGSPKSWVAINHIRDQILAPQERARKMRLWQKAVQYIRDHESRVREDVQRIYGEEHRVWMWIPDVHFSPQASPQGSPFFPLGPGASPQSHMPPQSHSSPVARVPFPMTTQASPPPSPSSAGGSPSTPLSNWQGAAFNALGKNVASPVVAPTNCLKVRHMFDQALMKMPGWVWLVKEELLKRCAHVADIVHLAVDQESNEGCVYVKAPTPDDAGRLFKALHGQWYRGNLVTVKYLREERYHEKFPDSKHQKNPLKTTRKS
jgi:membrane protein Man1